MKKYVNQHFTFLASLLSPNNFPYFKYAIIDVIHDSFSSIFITLPIHRTWIVSYMIILLFTIALVLASLVKVFAQSFSSLGIPYRSWSQYSSNILAIWSYLTNSGSLTSYFPLIWVITSYESFLLFSACAHTFFANCYPTINASYST